MKLSALLDRLERAVESLEQIERSARDQKQLQVTKFITAPECARRSGLHHSYFSKSARKLSWATQPGGDGTKWLFELKGFEKWLEEGKPDQIKRQHPWRPNVWAAQQPRNRADSGLTREELWRRIKDEWRRQEWRRLSAKDRSVKEISALLRIPHELRGSELTEDEYVALASITKYQRRRVVRDLERKTLPVTKKQLLAAVEAERQRKRDTKQEMEKTKNT